MSPSVDDAQAQWLEQLAAMRKAIADLNLPAEGQKPPAYGDEIEFDDEDFSGTASGEDIWDIISDEYEDEYSSDHLEQFADLPTGGSIYSQQWLAEKCANIAQRSSGLDAEALKEQISAILASDSNGKIIKASPNLRFSYIDFSQMRSSR
jgi:antiviral helicase SLH1